LKVYKYRLIDEKTGDEPKALQEIKNFRGEPATLLGFYPPKSANSEGRVLVRINGNEREVYPGVYGLKIVEEIKEL